MLRVVRPFAAGAVDVCLPLAVELFHRDGGPPAGAKRATHDFQPLPMMLGVIVYLAEQHNGVTSQAIFPVVPWRDGGTTGERCREPQTRQQMAYRDCDLPPGHFRFHLY